jgi:hypothetical protein
MNPVLKGHGFTVAEILEALKGHGFSRAVNATKMNVAFRPRGMVLWFLAREHALIRGLMPQEVHQEWALAPEGRISQCAMRIYATSSSAYLPAVARNQNAKWQSHMGLPQAQPGEAGVKLRNA